jgi:uncharacterized membrane protein
MVTGIEVSSRLFVSAILLLGSFSKCLNFSWFINTLKHYQLIPSRAARFVAVAVVFAEVIVGVGLLVARLVPLAAYGALLLFLTFTITTVVSLLRGKSDVDCGCNGFRKKAKIGWQLVVRNVGLVGFTLLSIREAFVVSPPALLSVFLSSLLLVSLSLVPELQLVKTDS